MKKETRYYVMKQGMRGGRLLWMIHKRFPRLFYAKYYATAMIRRKELPALRIIRVTQEEVEILGKPEPSARSCDVPCGQ
jgi:hypothetical protein